MQFLHSTTLVGLEAQFVRVEVDLAPGLPGFHIVGLPDTSVGESSHRVRSALRAAQHPLPARRCTVNLAPGDMRKEGPRFDLAIALGILACQQVFAHELLEEAVVLGELGLDGSLRPVRGVVNTALSMAREGCRRFLLPEENACELEGFDQLELWPARSLQEMLRWLQQGRPERHRVEASLPRTSSTVRPPRSELARVVGQPMGCLALEIAAAGGHHLLWIGPPGCGKTMLSSCLPEVLPPLDTEARLEVAAVHSALAMARPEQPFAQPHCRISAAALLGGALPGEVSRAHRGVLFLDEILEFSRDCLEGLRTALDSGWVEVGRSRYRHRFPASFQLVAACNPCPCGFFGDSDIPCMCTPYRRHHYLSRLSGPIRDRLDLQVALNRPDLQLAWAGGDTSTEEVRQRVGQARLRQQQRGCLNRDLPREYFQRTGALESAAWDYLHLYLKRWSLSLRAAERLLRIARSLADLRQRESIGLEQLAQATHFRYFDRFQREGLACIS